MQESTKPANFTIDENATCVDTVLRYRAENPTMPLFRRHVNGAWVNVTAAQFADEVDAVAKGLIASGVAAGDRVALLSSTRYEWTVIDYAIWRAGATTVAIFDTSSPDQVDWILTNSGASLVILETQKNLAYHGEVIKNCPEVRETLIIDDGAIAELARRGAAVTDADLDARHAGSNAADAATLIYTSGTTGRPKGVVLTHANFLAEAAAVRAGLGSMMTPGKSTLLFLPLAHVFARVIAITALENKVIVGHTSDIPNLVAHFAVFSPDFVLSVPRVFEKVYNSAEQKAIDGGKGKIFAKAAATAVEWSKAQDTGGAGLGLKLRHAVFNKLVYGKLRDALGGRCEAAVSGGGPLGARLGHFFRGAGVPIYEGYGLTETTAAVTANQPGQQKVGSVGRPVEGVSVAIAEDGEVLLKGPVVFGGYWKNEVATADAIVDGWFHTGDLGSLDDGYLSITGRKKEIIVTAGGKNVSPAQLEDTIRANALVSQCLVVGDAQPFIAALVTIDPEAYPGWLERNGLPADTPLSQVTENAALRAEIQTAIDAANATVSKAEAIKKFAILDSDFTVENGGLTPTLKLKRNVIHDAYKQAIADLYT
ncbi:MAG TPA: long-chain fatty acid--CoA ligase [Gordonia sp. (in: high G+C Gram-positive bacteria)]|uniref:AMP-dependent synthetase/ligase n=1 Tax=unclassified Gordonia (in: high G+C Gram-positive bacteria) TaxID=2657482 RepID=UPI000FA2F1D4|nr:MULTISPECIES: long-chain fatty acid--CoA ligase [unclassified Gordonia (in: high G+C Gram-positive bacteria)]RUP40869.1 MAG: long-chain fatty acid--CoA ligase [Gordonia sp. (in: high G+C Gram-positive bacteria)]HNP57689.1 long-chain fatty acid--CoA ligase [Gordonia sp. (in: high G+C Gram-positive bacteria)]HRC51332.1 long-chain fatty acid--CoA ligase [Gordonia sp. (in: high G+C Gram-positive bacteria)]